MKVTFVLISLLCSSFTYAKGVSYIQGVNFISAKCQAKTQTGETEFTLEANRTDATSVTDTVMGRGIIDHYEMPAIGVYSKTDNSDTTKRGGKAFIDFSYKQGSPSAQYNDGFYFVFTEIPREGDNVYTAQFWVVTGIGGYPNPMQAYYAYKGQGSCEIHLEKK